MASTQNNPWGLVVNPSLSLIAIRQSGGTAANPNGFNAIYDPAACNAFGYRTVTTTTRGTYCGSDTQSASRSITNEQRTTSAYGYGTFDITDNLQAFASVTL